MRRRRSINRFLGTKNVYNLAVNRREPIFHLLLPNITNVNTF
jgi:hypothetical protein